MQYFDEFYIHIKAPSMRMCHKKDVLVFDKRRVSSYGLRNKFYKSEGSTILMEHKDKIYVNSVK